MGKIRVKVIGDEEAEMKQKKDAQKRAHQRALEQSDSAQAEAKATEKTVTTADNSEEKAEEKKKVVTKKTVMKNDRSTKYKEVAQHVDRGTIYKLSDAVSLLPKLTIAKFDETVELHINTTDKGISGQMVLPHGTGKDTRVAIINPNADAAAADALIESIESGKINFDVLIATPDAMPRLARVARVLGPRGLMPNPKNGTVTPNPEEVAKKFAGGQINYKTESKFPILHLVVGKVSFGDKKLEENITTAIKTVQTKNIKNVTLKSTMSPGIKIDASTI